MKLGQNVSEIYLMASIQQFLHTDRQELENHIQCMVMKGSKWD